MDADFNVMEGERGREEGVGGWDSEQSWSKVLKVKKSETKK